MNTMHQVRTRLLQLLFLSLLISFALGINYLYAWTGPTGAAPTNNAPAPLNVSTASQVKLGNVSVGAVGNTATDYGLISYGRLRSTIGGVEFPDGSVQTAAASTANCATSSEIAITGTAMKTWNHGLGAQPTLMMPYLINKVAEKGYSVGDMFYLGSQTGDGTSVAGVGLVPNSTSVTIIFPSTTVNIGLNVTESILNKTGGPYTYITNANWRLVVRACVI